MLLGGRGRLVPAHVIYESVLCKLTWDAICIGGTITYTEEVSVQLWITHIFNFAVSQVEIKLVWEYPGHYNLNDYFKLRHIKHQCSGKKKPDRFFTSHLVSPHLVKLQFLIWNEELCWKTGHLVAHAWLCLQTFDPRIFGTRRHHPLSSIVEPQYYHFWRQMNLVSVLFQSHPEHMHLTQNILGLSANPCLVFTVFPALLKINTLSIFGCRSDIHLQDYLYDGSSSQMQMFFLVLNTSSTCVL